MKIVIVGASDSVWPVAALLAPAIPDHFELVVVEDLQAHTSFDGSSLGWGHEFLKRTGLTAERLALECAATFALGTTVRGVMEPGSENFIAQSGDLPRLNNIPIFKVLHLAAAMQNQAQHLRQFYQPFRFCTRAAKEGKLTLPVEDPSSPLALLAPVISFDRSKFTEVLKAEALKSRLSLAKGSVERCELGPGQSELKAVALADGSTVAGDVFVDVSGAVSRLSGASEFEKRLDVGPISLFDQIKIETPEGRYAGDQTEPDIHFGAMDLKLRLPSAQSMTEITLSNAGYGSLDENCSADEFVVWTSEAPWTGNLVRLGRASASLGPIVSTDLRLLCDQIVQFVALLPTGKEMTHEASAFNRIHRELQAEYLDYVNMMLHLNRRDEPFWSDVRRRPVSDRLSGKLSQFRHRGRFIPYEHEVYDQQNWLDSFIEFGLVPNETEPLLSGVNLQYLLPPLQQINADFERTIANMPDATQFIRDLASS